MKLDTSKIKFSNSDFKRNLILPERLTPELAEETGLHIGDGSMSFYPKHKPFGGMYSLRGHIHDDKEHYETRIKEIYKFVFNLDIPMREMKITSVYGFQMWTNGLVNFKHKILNLPLGNKINITIPKQFIDNKYIIDVIRGIFDTDGCIYLAQRGGKLYPRIQIGTISKQLSEQLINSLLKLGFRATRVIDIKRNENWNPLHTIYLRGDKMLKKWMETIAPNNQKFIAKFEYYLNNS